MNCRFRVAGSMSTPPFVRGVQDERKDCGCGGGAIGDLPIVLTIQRGEMGDDLPGGDGTSCQTRRLK